MVVNVQRSGECDLYRFWKWDLGEKRTTRDKTTHRSGGSVFKFLVKNGNRW